MPLPVHNATAHDTHLQPHLSLLVIACRVLRVSMETTFTAACLLHRYATAAAACPKDWVVASVIFLACKTEEEHRRLRDLINLVHMIGMKEDAKETAISETADTPTAISQLTWNPTPPKLDDNYWDNKQRIVQAEQHVLRCLAFDVHVAHPHRLVVLLVQELGLPHASVSAAWTWLNACVFR